MSKVAKIEGRLSGMVRISSPSPGLSIWGIISSISASNI